MDDIKLEEKKETPMGEDINPSLARSEFIEEDLKEEEVLDDLKSKLKQIELPVLTKISAKELQNDIFTILIRPPIIRYVTSVFMVGALVGSIIC